MKIGLFLSHMLRNEYLLQTNLDLRNPIFHFLNQIIFDFSTKSKKWVAKKNVLQGEFAS